jgi:ectoine hydroxylase-related dioxygenase (phytanoyl-CoA dioxygenase family)
MQIESLKNLDNCGHAIIEHVVGDSVLAELAEYFQTVTRSQTSHERNGSTFAMRNLLRDHQIVRQLADSTAIRALIDPVLGTNAIAVRGILFDKTPGANWKVPWHQDLSIAVTKRAEIAGYGPWSIKAGVPHVQPPVAVLEKMLTVRLHLDDCGVENGPLLVIPGSHAHGILSGGQVADFRQRNDPVACTTKRGGVVLMRPLLLHASHTATSPEHRRVIHLEYAAFNLPSPLGWFIA